MDFCKQLAFNSIIMNICVNSRIKGTFININKSINPNLTATYFYNEQIFNTLNKNDSA